MTETMIVRMNPVLKSQVDRLARSEGKSTSEVVRGLLADYVKNRDVSAHIDDIWDRMGKKLRAHGKTVKDVERAIREVRAEKRAKP